MKRKNRIDRMQQKRMETLERFASRYDFDVELALNDWHYVWSLKLPIHIHSLIKAIQNTRG